MTVLAAVAGLLGTVVSAAGQMAAARAEQRAADFNAEVLTQQAASEREAAAAEGRDFRRREMRQVASARTARLATGVTLEGSPLLVDQATVREIALGASRYRHRGEIKANRMENEAELERFRGKSAKQAGYFQAGASLLSGFGNFASSMMMPMPGTVAY